MSNATLSSICLVRAVEWLLITFMVYIYYIVVLYTVFPEGAGVTLVLEEGLVVKTTKKARPSSLSKITSLDPS